MGRDVAGLRVDNKPSWVNVNSNGSNIHGAAVHVAPKVMPEEVGNEDIPEPDHLVPERTENQEVLNIKNTYHEPAEEKFIRVEDQPIEDDQKSARFAVNGTSSLDPLPQDENYDEEEISYIDNANGDESNYSGLTGSPQSNDQQSPETTETALQPRSPSSFMKHQRELLKHQHLRNQKYYDETKGFSSATSGRNGKPKVTVPVAPKFCCGDRLERRKKFYDKLEEKHRALEKEKLEYEARMKEEEQETIRRLRKNMVYKANPVPSFYYEGPPPKPELKKFPVTRAKSPNLTRRKSCSDAEKTGEEDKGFLERASRHSVGSKEGRK